MVALPLQISAHQASATQDWPAGMTVWSLRFAIFAVTLAGSAVALHRLLSFPTPQTLNLIALSFAIAGSAIVLSLGGFFQVWRRGGTGAAQGAAGLLLAGALLAWPALYWPVTKALPRINDVTTDWDAPPAFAALLLERGPGTNTTAYVPAYAPLQRRAYPDLKPIIIERSVEDAFLLAREFVRRLKWKLAAEQAPDERQNAPGIIEAVDRTLIMGFHDDVVVRVVGDSQQARIDIRSASRYGRHDLGRNATRIRKFTRELFLRLEFAVPALKQSGKGRKAKQPVKRRKDRSDDREGRRK